VKEKIMDKKKIVVIPPTAEQEYPCFHVEEQILQAFCEHLRQSDLQGIDEPRALGDIASNSQELFEIDVTESSEQEMEAVAESFFRDNALDNQ
jgi:hypothetical protein